MARKRKTKADRDAEFWRAKNQVWDVFRRDLAAADSIASAVGVLRSMPGESAPGRLYYTNLSMLLLYDVVPGGASDEELRLYRDVLLRIAELTQEDRPKCDRLRCAVEDRLRR